MADTAAGKKRKLPRSMEQPDRKRVLQPTDINRPAPIASRSVKPEAKKKGRRSPSRKTTKKITKTPTVSTALVSPQSSITTETPQRANRNLNAVYNVDICYQTDPQFCTTYVKEIMLYLEEQERKTVDYMVKQKFITPEMRATLMDWLIEISHEYDISSEALFLAKTIVDRILEIEIIPKTSLQLLGIAAIFLASKYEDVDTPSISEFVFLCDGTYTSSQIVERERTIFVDRLEYNLSFPTEVQFLNRYFHVVCHFLKLSVDEKKDLLFHSSFFCETSLPLFSFTQFKPSIIAASCLSLALHTLHSDPWPTCLEFHAKRDWHCPSLRKCLRALQNNILRPSNPELTAVIDKYEKKALVKLVRAETLKALGNIFEFRPLAE